jgi:energy-coupling factor transport system ATP-binding protein
MIDFDRWSYWYPDAAEPALRDVTLRIPKGAFVLVAGPSGSGKSTLLRALNGLVPHFTGGRVRGRLQVAGHDPAGEGTPAMAPLVGFVFQDPEAQFVTGQVEDEIAFALENAAVPRAEMLRRVDDILAALSLTPLRHRAISTLSGGEMQRVAIASALVLRPGILVLDEPTSQLDPESADDVLAALDGLREALGLTVVLAEHRLERVLSRAQSLILVEGGRARIGPPAELLRGDNPIAPPIIRLAWAMGWPRAPLTVEQARAMAPERGHGVVETRHGASLRPSPENLSLLRPVPEPHPELVEGVEGAERPALQPLRQAQGPALAAVRLDVEDLEAVYDDAGGRVQALDGVSLQARAGEIVAVMGRNGSGKSSLLKCLVGLLPATRGAVSIDGRSVLGRPTWEICRDVAYLPQNPNLMLFADTVALELRETLRNHGITGAAADAPVAALLEKLDLSRYAESYPRDLSAGERQRVAFGAVTVTGPGVILLDEPTRGLDALVKRGLAELLRKWREGGAALVVITHDVEFVAELADRVVVLETGRVIADGPTLEVMTSIPALTPQVPQVFPGFLTVEEAAIALAGG